MGTSLKPLEKSEKIKWGIWLVIGILIMLTPETELYTKDIKIFLTITCLAILAICFELTHNLVPAVLMPTAYYITGIVPTAVAFNGWSQPIAWMILGAFLLANVLNETGVLHRIAYFCIKSVGGTFNGALYGLYIAGVVLAAESVNSAYAIVVTLAYSMCLAFGFQPKSKEAAVVMMVGATAALLPGVFLYRPTWAGVIVSAAQTVDPNFMILWQDVPIYNAPAFLMGFVYVFALTKIFKTSKMNAGDTKAYFKSEYEKLGKMRTEEKKALAVVTVILIYVLTYPLHGKNINWAFMTLPWLAFMPGTRFATVEAIKN